MAVTFTTAADMLLPLEAVQRAGTCKQHLARSIVASRLLIGVDMMDAVREKRSSQASPNVLAALRRIAESQGRSVQGP
jgi:hypothetical protein